MKAKKEDEKPDDLGILEMSMSIAESQAMTKKREAIKQALIKQLEKNLIKGLHYYDLVEDYMSMWDIKNNLILDIKRRGVSIRWENGPNQVGYIKNASISELNKTNAQMLKILNELGLKAVAEADPNDDL